VLISGVAAPLGVNRDRRWIAAGAVAAAVFVFVLGQGVRLKALGLAPR
jgi:hypothetical protein